LGMNRGGIDERWFGSTTKAANENRNEDEGLSWCVHAGERFLLRDAVAELKDQIIGEHIWNTYQKWPVYSKFFDNMGPIPHHMHQNSEQAALVGQEGKPESYYFPPQMNQIGNNFPYTFMGLEPGTTRQDVIDCLDRWNDGDNGLLDLSKAYRLKPGTGWLIPPCVLHAPGSLVTYEPQWGSDVFGMYQNLVEGREVPRSLLTKDFPEEYHNDNAYLVNALDWEKNIDPNFKDSNYLEPIVSEEDDGWCDRWIVYGQVDGKQLFTAKELTLEPGAKCTVRDGGAYCWITVQGMGRMQNMNLQAPVMIRFGEMTKDEVFVAGILFMSATVKCLIWTSGGCQACRSDMSTRSCTKWPTFSEAWKPENAVVRPSRTPRKHRKSATPSFAAPNPASGPPLTEPAGSGSMAFPLRMTILRQDLMNAAAAERISFSRRSVELWSTFIQPRN